MAASPQQLFCDILGARLEATQTILETVVQEPNKFARVINSNIDRVTNYVYATTYEAVNKIYETVWNLLLLNKINELLGVGSWCRAAWACEALMNELTGPKHEIYLPFLTEQEVQQIRTNYELFEIKVCRVGIKGIVDGFMTDIFQRYYDLLQSYKLVMNDQLRINELVERYNSILDEAGVYDTLNLIRQFLNCVNNGFCDYSKTAENILAEWEEKLMISRNSESWAVDLSKKLVKFDEKKAKLDAKIEETEKLIMQRARNAIKKEDVMIQ